MQLKPQPRGPETRDKRQEGGQEQAKRTPKKPPKAKPRDMRHATRGKIREARGKRAEWPIESKSKSKPRAPGGKCVLEPVAGQVEPLHRPVRREA